MRRPVLPAIALGAAVFAFSLSVTPAAEAEGTPDKPLTFDQAIALAHTAAPDLKVASANEVTAKTAIGIAGIYPNPSVSFGTSTKAAKYSGTLSMPLLVLGQLGASKDAAAAEYKTVTVESEMVWLEVRTAAAHAFVGLWRAEQIAEARALASLLTARVDEAVKGRVQAGVSPDNEALRSNAERLRAEADALDAAAAVAVARAGLGRWIGAPTGVGLSTVGEPKVPLAPPTLGTLLARVDENPIVRRERADVAAAEAREKREKAFVRPLLVLDLGFDTHDPNVEGTNYRAVLGVEIPLFNFRGPLIDREVALATAAKARASVEAARLTADLSAAFFSFSAASARTDTLLKGVVPAAELAADATRESYALGRAPLVAVLDAERARLEARVSLIEARAARADAWIDVERIVP